MPDPSLVIKRIRWKEEISVEEGRQLLERTFYPFKQARVLSAYTYHDDACVSVYKFFLCRFMKYYVLIIRVFYLVVLGEVPFLS